MTELNSINPATGNIIWRGPIANASDVDKAIKKARAAFEAWRNVSYADRVVLIKRFADIVKQNAQKIATAISEETGKVYWDALGEANASAAKIDISIQAYEERTGKKSAVNGDIRAGLEHRPHGVMVVFGPYNFPVHLPNGHIVPALLAGNSVVFKPSDLTPKCGELMASFWKDAGLPDGVLNLVQGGAECGQALVAHPDINGVLFTGSVPTGKAIASSLAARQNVILALEMGGNNPLIFESAGDLQAAAIITVQSAYLSTGQRCTCARRLIVPQTDEGDRFIEALLAVIDRIKVGLPDDKDEPFMGSMISEKAAKTVLDKQQALVQDGGKILRAVRQLDLGKAFISPGLIDVSDIADRGDEECFGPLLQLVRVPDIEAAIAEANRTAFGLSAGILTENRKFYELFFNDIRAGIVNWNQPLTGASSAAPFGGIGDSGNHRASAYYAADYCAYPVASMDNNQDRVSFTAMPKGIRA